MLRSKILIAVSILILFLNCVRSHVDVTNDKIEIGNAIIVDDEISQIELECKMSRKERLNKKEKEFLKVLILAELKDACEKYNFRYSIAEKLLNQESRFNYLAMSQTGAEGLMQFTEITLKDYPHDVYDYKATIDNGVKYLSSLRDRFRKKDISWEDSYVLAVASYNCGMGRILKDKRFITKGETRNYIKVIFDEETLNKFTEEIVDVKDRKDEFKGS